MGTCVVGDVIYCQMDEFMALSGFLGGRLTDNQLNYYDGNLINKRHAASRVIFKK